MTSTPSYFAIIPGHIRICRTIEANAKLLYGEISSLCNLYGYCWASNEYFAEMFNVHRTTVVRWLKSLKDHKFIVVETELEGIQRRRKIWLSRDAKMHFQKSFAKVQKCTDVGAKMHQGVPPTPYYMNSTNINISPPIPPQSSPPKSKKEESSPAAREVSEYLKSKIQQINPNFSSSTEKWPKIIEEILKKKSAEHLKSLIHWTFNNDFWKTVIVSPKNLKNNLDAIEAKMVGEKGKWKSNSQQKTSSNEKNESQEEHNISRKPISEADIQKLHSRYPEIFGNKKS